MRRRSHQARANLRRERPIREPGQDGSARHPHRHRGGERQGGVLGRKVEWITADTETNPAAGSRVAERFITREDCLILIGALHSGVANAITQVANKYGAIYLNTNSSAPSARRARIARASSLSGTATAPIPRRLPVKNAVDLDRQELAPSSPTTMSGATPPPPRRRPRSRPQAARSWTICSSRRTRATSPPISSRSSRRSGRGRGGGRRRRHQGAAPAGRAVEARRQAGLDQQPAGLAWTSSASLESLFGVFGTTWYHAPAPRRRRVRREVEEDGGEGAISVPGNVSYNGYMATRELWARHRAAGSVNNIKIIKALEGHKMPATERMQYFDAWIDLNTHQVQQMIYLARCTKPLTTPTTSSSPGRSRRTRSTTRRPLSASSRPTSRCRRWMRDEPPSL